MALLGGLTLAYPLLVYWSLGRIDLRWLALGLIVLAGLRMWSERQRTWVVVAAGVLLLAALAALTHTSWPLKLYPVLVSLAMLAVFGYSLINPPTVIERLARLHDPDLPPHAVAYTRRVTQVWCGFFIFNGSVALFTALWADDRVWALYNGLISYGLMGTLFAGEWLLRQRVRRSFDARSSHV